MKPIRTFIILIIALYVCLFCIDYAKATFFAVSHHSLIVWLKTFFLVVAGSAIMYHCLDRSFFKTFLGVYLGIWVVYFLLRNMPSSLSLKNVVEMYVRITQLYTPLPFIVFWILNRVFVSEADTRQQ